MWDFIWNVTSNVVSVSFSITLIAAAYALIVSASAYAIDVTHRHRSKDSKKA